MLNFQTQPPSLHFLFRKDFTVRSDKYKELGQFSYDQPHCTTHHISTCIHKDNYWIYIGEVKEGTDDIPHGLGIQVNNSGNIYEGYWKDGKLHGRGRYIGNWGIYYIGEWKEGSYDGEGAYYYFGTKYEGNWNNNRKYGQGTLYHGNGDKYTGQWDGNKGQGEVNYKDGTKYTGQWNGSYQDEIKKDGLGTLYSADGQVLKQGQWEEGEYVGKE